MLLLTLACAGSAPEVVSPAPLCPELAGFEVDLEQRWQVHAGSVELESGSWSRSVSLGEDVETLRSGLLVSRDGNVAEFEDRRRYRCDGEGLWWLERDLWLSVDDGERVQESVQRLEWELPVLMLPSGELSEGDSWEGVERYVLTIDGEPDAPLEKPYRIELGARLLVTTPAGTFEAYQWRKDDRVDYLAPGLGLVRDKDGELL